MPDEPHDKPQSPGAVPQFVSPHQVTAPLPLAHGPWGYPPPPPPPPPPREPKKEGGGLDLAVKLIGIAVLLGGIIYSAGAMSEKLRHIDENQRAADARWVEHRRQEEESRSQDREARASFEKKVGDALEQIKQQARARHGRRRDAVDDRP